MEFKRLLMSDSRNSNCNVHKLLCMGVENIFHCYKTSASHYRNFNNDDFLLVECGKGIP